MKFSSDCMLRYALVLFPSSVVALTGCVTAPTAAQQATEPQTTQASGPTFAERLNASINAVGNAIVAPVQTGNTKAGSTSTDGRLHLRDIAIKDIISTSGSNEWPRVAVTVNKLPKWFYAIPPSGVPGRYSAIDCIAVSLTVWSDPKSAVNYDNIAVCGDDIVRNTPFKDIGLMWKSFGIVSSAQHTGAQRTRGPLPPQHLFPNKPGYDLFFNPNGSYYIGSIMMTLGYNWNEAQDYRFWFVNVPTQADVSRQ
ncbi:hypothetical protein H8L32_21535 [Undibacterium sp. CY18W]|uniref:Uncharacterized protein n=1 Tax=Undibacterium hunanense TaxID=2762292 RepID=A0ABR6ZWA2_9BURK|nr:hypothetical protein [Undibacterium hunanense]MBC3920064.1 hypothetical protein [Undibacterium hunanense]